MENEFNKNTYLVDDEEVLFRRADIHDNRREIAALIYDTDPYIYPFWFKNDREEAINILSDRIDDPGFIFNANNIYIARNKNTGKIIGIVIAIDKSVDLNYDYSSLSNISKESAFTIDNYIRSVIDEINTFEIEDMYLINVCVDSSDRGKQIGKRMLGYFISQMEKREFSRFHLEVLLHNLRAKNLYHSFGFREMVEIVGFDGTTESKVEVVTMLRKKGEYLPEEFMVK